MKIWIDGDSCPKAVRDLVAKAGVRNQVAVICVANRPIPFSFEGVEMVVVENVEGAADRYLVLNAKVGDLVLTRDIPLAAELVEAKVAVLNDRGNLYTAENIRERLSIRNFMAELNSMGLKPDRTSQYGKKEWDSFARTFDREFQKLLKLSKG